MGVWKVSAPLPFLALVGFLQRVAAAPSSPQECPKRCYVYDGAVQKCYSRCPAGTNQETECPLDLQISCIKMPCGPESYLDLDLGTPKCMQCVNCPKARHLVEISPCTQNSKRICACESGWYCNTPVSNSCARCTRHSFCKPGFGVKTRGTADKDTVCEKCPPGTFSDENSSTQPCKTHTSCTKLNKLVATKGNATHDERCGNQLASQVSDVAPAGIFLGTSPAGFLGALTTDPGNKLDSRRSTGNLGTTDRKPPDKSNTSHIDVIAEETSRRGEGDFTLLGVLLLLGLVLCACSVTLWRWRACDKWIVPHKGKISNRAKICAKQIKMLSAAENVLEEGDPTNVQPLTEAPEGGLLLETEEPPVLDLGEAELVQADGGVPGDPPPQCTNCIEKIYIMRADTVIVGSISEVPSGKTGAAREEEGNFGIQEEVEAKDVTVHYPEQETEFYPESDVTTPVEEEWEFHYSAEKTLAI